MTCTASTLNLDSPFSSLVPSENDYQVKSVSRSIIECTRGVYTINSPIRALLAEDFFIECFGKPDKLASLFARRADLDLEHQLRRILLPHWLALNMSQEEIQLAETDPTNFALKPLYLLKLNNYGFGLASRALNLNYYGIFLVRDFIRAYQQEEKLPTQIRWKSLGRGITKPMLLKVKVAIESEQNPGSRVNSDGQNADLSQPITAPSQVQEWLRATKLASRDKKIRDACGLLLMYLKN